MIIPPKENISNDESLTDFLVKDSGGRNTCTPGAFDNISASTVCNTLTIPISLILALK